MYTILNLFITMLGDNRFAPYSRVWDTEGLWQYDDPVMVLGASLAPDQGPLLCHPVRFELGAGVIGSVCD